MKIVQFLPQHCCLRRSARVECTSWVGKEIVSKDQVGMRKLVCLDQDLTEAQNRNQIEQTHVLKAVGCTARDSPKQHGTLLAEEHPMLIVLGDSLQPVAASTLRTVCY
jgi:hypothetical protein